MLNYLASNSKRSFHLTLNILTFNITTSKMNYQNLFKIAIRAIAANKMRSFLTALGIIIGIAAVITMLAIGQGSKASIKANIAEMGSNMIMISPGADMRGGVRQDASSMETLKQADYQSIKDECNYISAISPTVNSSGQWIYGNNNTQSSIYGVNQDYLSIRQLKVADGEMFTDTDIKAASKVCILGQTVVNYLFPDGSDPIGKVVRFNSIPFRVIGVLKKKGYNSMGMDQDDLVLAPYTTVMKRIMAQTYLGGIVCSAITEEASQPAQDQITEILRRNHKLKDATDTTEADEDDFNIRSQEEISSMMNSTMSTITILLGSVAGISLLVGGIGIMNIMYVSVTERTREIGLRMSVGARGIDILNQFLIEAILLSVTGGIIGVILGVSLSLSLNYFFHIATQIEPWSIIMSFAVCTFTGVFFGWYPAKKAARLDPIEAIRYE
jgi:putative ABC transport system permease protein